MRTRASRTASLSLAAAFALFFAPALFTANVPYYRDTLATIIPFRHYLHARLLAGELPQWYPREALGVPFIGQLVTATFHPQTFLFLWLPPVQAVKWNLLVFYAVALVGAYRLARAHRHERAAAVLGAFAFGFGGYPLGISHNLVYLGALATLPWVALFARRLRETGAVRHVAALGLCWGLVALQGDAQGFLLASLLVAGFGGAAIGLKLRAAATRFGVAAAIAALITLPELLPALLLAPDTARAVGAPAAGIGLTWALHPLRALEFVSAGFVPDAVRNELTQAFFAGDRALWATTLFAGVVPLLLIALALRKDLRRNALYAALMLLGVWLALGDRGGLLPLLAKILPLLRQLRYPEKYLALSWVCAVPLVAAGASQLRAARRPVQAGLAAAAILAVLALSLGREASVAAMHSGLALSDGFDAEVSHAWRRGLLLSAAGALLFSTLSLRRTRPQTLWLLALVTFAELYLANSAHLPLIPPEVLTTANPLASAVAPHARVIRNVQVNAPSTVTLGDGARWAFQMRRTFHPDTGELDGVSVFDHNTPATSWRWLALLGPGRTPPRAELYAGCFILGVAGQNAASIARDEETGLELIGTPCEPKSFIAPSVSVQGWQLARERLGATKIVSEGGDEATSGTGMVAVVEDRPESLKLRVEAHGRSAVYVADAFASGWSAQVDGKETAIFPANVAARAVFVDAGSHEVTFSYRTPGLGAGLLLGGVGWLLAVALIAFDLRRRQPSLPSASGSIPNSLIL